MDEAQLDRGKLYSEYRAEIEGQPLTRALRRAVIVLCVIQTVFILVDWIVYPDQFWRFLPVRVGLNAVLAVIFFWSCKSYPLVSSFATAFAGGAMLFTVVLGTGGASSDYYVGLVLLLIGIGVLAPLSTKQGAFAIGALLIAYFCLEFFSDSPRAFKSGALNTFFLVAAAFEGIMCCAYLDRMRFGDFLQRRELENARDELKALDEEKSRFTANVHHELRTPLTLLLAPIDAFLDGRFGTIDDNQRSYFESMRANGRRLLNLINNLLDVAKAESGKLELDRVRTHPVEVLLPLVEAAKPLAEQKGIHLESAFEPEINEIFADQEALTKIAVNLIGNALKFTESGGSVSVSCANGQQGSVEIVVTDTGIGLANDQLERIFNRFAQVDSSSTRKHEGTGIGLALTKELVSAHGGEVWAESEGIGQGTTIRVSLPRGDGEDSSLDRAEESSVLHTAQVSTTKNLAAQSHGTVSERFADIARENQRSESEAIGWDRISGDQELSETSQRVLVVEDNPDMRRLLHDILATKYRVSLAENGRVGLESVHRCRPSLVLTDVMMPEMSGIELCSELKSSDEFSDIPVVLVTSKAESEMKIRGLELGADDYVTKPFHPRELLARVDSLVRLHELQDMLKSKNSMLEETNSSLERALAELQQASSQLARSERLAAVGELAAGIAHEANNPVNYAANAARIIRSRIDEIEREIVGHEAGNEGKALTPSRGARLERDGLPHVEPEEWLLREKFGAVKELVEIVSDGLQRTERLVGDLRNFAAPDRSEKAETTILNALRSTINLMKHNASSAEIDIELVVDNEIPNVIGDQAGLNQVFLNLLKNAVEATEGIGNSVVVRASATDEWVEICFEDSGPGVDPAVAERIFEPFFSTKDGAGGTGMGLPVSQRIVSDHKGEILVRMNAKGGASFVVRLPAQNPRGGGSNATAG